MQTSKLAYLWFRVLVGNHIVVDELEVLVHKVGLTLCKHTHCWSA